jgi:hypothetical protein
MNLKIVSTILFALSLIQILLGLQSILTIYGFIAADSSFVNDLRVVNDLRAVISLIFYVFTAYFFWNFRQRVN